MKRATVAFAQFTVTHYRKPENRQRNYIMNHEGMFREWLVAEKTSGLDVAIHQPADIVPHLQKWNSKPEEHFILVTLNGKHEVLKTRVVSKGILDRTIVHPREVFRPAIIDRAAGILIAHNHPSGCEDPSPEDKELTKRMRDAGELIGIPVLDHVIVTKKGYYSFLEKGELL